MIEPRSLAGQRALVTGAAGAIGAAVCAELAARGAVVYAADLDPVAVAAAVAGIPRATGLPLDVSDTAAVRAVVDRLAGDGPLDILINNAGVFALEGLLDVTEQTWDRLFAVNTRGLFFTLQAVAALMTAAGVACRIVNVASQAGRRGEAMTSIYAATKAAVISLTRSAALALAGAGIRVNAVAPGVVDTAMFLQVDRAYAVARGIPAGAFTAEATAAVPLGRLGAPGEVAAAVGFLASAESSYMTGQVLVLDGGAGAG